MPRNPGSVNDYAVASGRGDLKVIGNQEIVGLAASTSLTVPQGAYFAFIQAQGQSIRWKDNNTNPTTTSGFILDPNETLWYPGDLTKFRAIQVLATATLYVSYYGYNSDQY